MPRLKSSPKFGAKKKIRKKVKIEKERKVRN